MNNALLVLMFLLLSSISGIARSNECGDIDQQVLVSAVYPTADVLPENLLRFYVYFNQPMKTENALSHVYLTNESGMKLDGVFIENKFALWSPDRKRLTLLFDPGRVKTGLVAHNTLGRALDVGLTYNLVVDAGQINDQECSSTFVKTFSVSEANYNRPLVSGWKINQPQKASRTPLTIDFQSPIDHTSLAFRIRVKDSIGKVVSGAIDIGFNESQWIFKPDKSWHIKESYSVFVDPILEDIVGNRVTGLFDQPSLIEESINQNQHIKIPIKFSE